VQVSASVCSVCFNGRDVTWCLCVFQVSERFPFVVSESQGRVRDYSGRSRLKGEENAQTAPCKNEVAGYNASSKSIMEPSGSMTVHMISETTTVSRQP
jgi:hypothetical protein